MRHDDYAAGIGLAKKLVEARIVQAVAQGTDTTALRDVLLDLNTAGALLRQTNGAHPSYYDEAVCECEGGAR